MCATTRGVNRKGGTVTRRPSIVDRTTIIADGEKFAERSDNSKPAAYDFRAVLHAAPLRRPPPWIIENVTTRARRVAVTRDCGRFITIAIRGCQKLFSSRSRSGEQAM